MYEEASRFTTGVVSSCARPLKSDISIIVGKLFYRRDKSVWRDYDFILLAGVVLLLAQSGLVVHAASLGIGRHADTLDDASLDSLAKTQFAISILWVIVMFCTKLSMCWFIDAINTYAQIQWANRFLVGIISAFSLAGIIATGFRCPLPTPWIAASATACSAAVPVHTLILTSCIITDVLICAIAIVMVTRVQTTSRVKALIICLFSNRLLVVAAVSVALTNTSYIINGSGTDFTWEALLPNTWLIVASHLSVITACIPSLKGVLNSWLGNTFGIEIDSPYQLERIRGAKAKDGAGFAVTDYAGTKLGGSSKDKSDSRSKGSILSKLGSRPNNTSGGGGKTHMSASPAAGLKLTTSLPTEALCYANSAEPPVLRSCRGGGCHKSQPISSSGKQDGRSDSIRGLTEGVIMIHSDVEVKFDDFDQRDGSSYSSRG
ncbi:hypothetical protein MN608_01165 [Microdochium nivale]|nr:hypothetical protein MN608_01165 [Microdochium nivale]